MKGELPTRRSAAFARTADAATPGAAPVEVTVTQRLGRFVLLRKLGEGGMGAVFAAYDEQLDRRIAVKLLRRLDQEQSAHRLRVLREAQAMARVSHENVLHVYEVGEIGGQIFIAMELIDGLSLTSWQRQRKFSWRELLRVYRQAGRGLLAAHRAGLVHRDFKPDNVLIDSPSAEGRARVADFGLARLQSSAAQPPEAIATSPASALSSSASMAGAIVGTPGYMSPEQYQGREVDARSDQFSFCVAVYEALYGAMPWRGDDAAGVAADTLGGLLRPPPTDSPVPSTIFAALRRGLATDPAARFASMAELLEALNPDNERESADAAAARRRTTALGIGFSALLFVITLDRSLRNLMSLRDLTLMTVLLTAGTIAMTLLARHSLLSNALHRGFLFRSLILFITSLGIRCVGLRFHFETATLMPFDFLAVGGITATLAQQYAPALWWAVAGFVAATLATLGWPHWTVLVALCSYTLYGACWYYGWARITHQHQPQDRSPLPAAP